MNLRTLPFRALLAVSIASVALPALSQNSRAGNAAQASPFGGTVVEEVIARVNDQIISRSDYDRALQDLEQQGRQQGASQQEIDAQKKDLLRDLVDRQLLLSKGKELGITGETELVRELDNIRKQYKLDSMEDLQKAAEAQGVNYEDYKATIRNRIITQEVMREEVGRRLGLTHADVEKYYEQHKSEFNRPESVHLSEILIPTTAAGSAPAIAPATPDDATLAAAKAKADDVEAKLKAGGNFEELAKTVSTGPTAAQGGDLGVFKRGQLAKVLEDQTFQLQAGQFTEPIRTKQGFIIFKVLEHTPGGQVALKDIEPQVEDAVAQEKMEPAVRRYLHTLREQAYIDYKPGYVDTAAVVNPGKPVYSAYTPPSPKKKKKVVRTRYRQKARREKGTETSALPSVPSLAQVPHSNSAAPGGTTAAAPEASGTASSAATETAQATPPANGNPAPTAAPDAAKTGKTRLSASTSSTTMKPGKKEKIRFGQAPRETLPKNDNTRQVDAGSTAAAGNEPAGAPATPSAPAETQVASNVTPMNGDIPQQAPEKQQKKRFSDRAKLPKDKKHKGPQADPFAPPSASDDEVATQKTQSTPLGLAGDTAKPKKKPRPDHKVRLQDEQKKPATDQSQPSGQDATPPQTAPAPQQTPAPAPQQ